MMKLLPVIFQLVRWPNLVFIFLTQFLFLTCILQPEVSHTGGKALSFWLLTLAYVLVAAAGYVINDYYDLEIDQINKPDKVFINRGIGRSAALGLYAGLNGLALAAAAGCSLVTRNPAALVATALCAWLLYLYSARLKKSFLAGNLLVSAITASSVFILPLALPVDQNPWMLALTALYSLFAFLVSMVRELVKDLEDAAGDAAYGAQTLAIRLGPARSHLVALLMLTPVVLSLLWLAVRLWSGRAQVLALYLLLLVCLPLCWLGWRLTRAQTPAHYHRLSTGIKIIMLTGILSMAVVRFVN